MSAAVVRLKGNMLVIPCDTFQLQNFMDMGSVVPELLQTDMTC